MTWILDNWYMLIGLLAVITCAVMLVRDFLGKPNAEQLTAFKEWLKYGVTMAEKELGSGTGQLKLRFVWDLALSKFPWIEKIMEFDMFSVYVDEALIWLGIQLDKNAKISTFVGGESNEGK